MNQEKDPQKNSTGAADTPETAPQEQPETAASAAEPEDYTEKEAAEQPAPEESTGKKKKKDGPSYFQSEKFKHGGTATAFTAGFIAVIILLNVLVGILSDKFPSVNLDVTKASTNTLSADCLKIVDKVKISTTIYICATKEACENNTVSASTNGAADYAQVSRLMAKAAERNSNIKLEYVDLVKDPTFASEYKNDSIAEGDVIVKSDKRYRVLTASELFTTQTSQTDGTTTYLSNVDGALATALNAAISDTMPVAAFETGHSEQIDSSAYKKQLENSSFETKEFNLLTDKIPENTQLLVLGCPTQDYTDAEITKIDNFLHDKTSSNDRSLLFTTSAGQKSLPKLNAFLEEWGLSVDPSTAVVETSTSKYFDNQLNIFADVQSKLDLGSSVTSYKNFLMPYSTPVTIKSDSVGSKTTYSLVKSSDSSVLAKNNSVGKEKAAYDIAALSRENMQKDSKIYHANVIVSGSTLLFSSQLMNSSIFGNGAYTTSLSQFATGTSASDSKISTTTHEQFARDISVTAQGVAVLGYGVFTILLPLIVVIAGIVMFRKRRAL